VLCLSFVGEVEGEASHGFDRSAGKESLTRSNRSPFDDSELSIPDRGGIPRIGSTCFETKRVLLSGLSVREGRFLCRMLEASVVLCPRGRFLEEWRLPAE
jgi:hypothetical protein